ncbi:ribonuclease H [Halomarina oriensis]|uniref:Ribonuclease H n=1 Tax=Halomarina oriensis TaxID=671145 RepID=A0A6B0GJQ4_9EURY|nr:ribonuclease H [Halomarina oriensis]MWG35044.1 ribonuclease H [Halomarina oriensis]
MAAYGRPTLRDLFDESPTPHIAHPPRTHHRDYYVATDGSFREASGGLGVVIETRDGETVARRSVTDAVPDNNVAEYRALHLGLDLLATRAPRDASVGIVLDHDDLAANVNRAALAARQPAHGPPHPYRVPVTTQYHWRGIRARIAGFREIRAARIDSGVNPAHCLANAPDQYAFVNDEPARCVLPSLTTESPGPQYPPPSRANRNTGNASD